MSEISGQGEQASVDQERVQLEALVENAEVGSPEFMAFWDYTDQLRARSTIASYKTAIVGKVDPAALSIQRLALINERIAQRASEKPGYLKAFHAQMAVIDPLATKNPIGNLNHLTEIRTAIATK